MGIGWHLAISMDSLLLLYLEGRQMDRKSRVFYGFIPLCVTYGITYKRHHITRSHGRNQILRHAKYVQAQRI